MNRQQREKNALCIHSNNILNNFPTYSKHEIINMYYDEEIDRYIDRQIDIYMNKRFKHRLIFRQIDKAIQIDR